MANKTNKELLLKQIFLNPTIVSALNQLALTQDLCLAEQ